MIFAGNILSVRTSRLFAALSLLSVVALGGCSAAHAAIDHVVPASPSPKAIAESPTAVTKTADTDGDGLGSFELCAKGSFPSYAIITAGNPEQTKTLQPGSCTTEKFPQSADHIADIYGIDENGPFMIGSDSFGGAYDEHIKTTGTADKPDFFAF